MRFPSVFACVIVFCVWLSYEIKKGNKTSSAKQSILEMDAKANNVRKQPLDNLHYITIPMDSLPFFSGIDEKLTEFENTIKSLSTEKIVNLTGITNIELKMEYGAANLPTLMEYDQNFIVLARTLLQWGKRLDELGYTKEAIQVLEFGIDCHTDAKGNYTLLARLYQDTNQSDKIAHLYDVASQLNTSQKDLICRDLGNFS